MFFYICLFLFVVIVSFVYSYAKEINVIFLSKSLLFFLLFLPLALRNGVGTDYKNYVDIFNGISEGVYSSSLEPGWILLNKLVLKCNLSVQWIFIISAFITIFFVLKTPRKYSFVIIILFFSLYYLEAYNIVRQCMAMSICWYSFLCYKERKKVKSILFIFFAIMFHYASILFLICIIMMDVFYFSEKVFLIILFFIFLFVQSGLLVKFITLLLSFTKYGVYLERADLFTNLKSGGTGGFITFFIRSLILIAMYFSIPKNVLENEKNYCRIMILFLFTFDLLGVNIFIFQRVRAFFFLSYMIVFVYICNRKKFVAKLQNFVYISFFIAYYLLLKLLTGAGQIIPYAHI